MKRVTDKADKAVSPVIGTVLLIAITVTLVASVYTVLGGYFNGLPQPSPTVSLSVVNSTSQKGGLINGTYTLSVNYISNNVSTDHVKVQISMNNTNVYEFMLSNPETQAGQKYTIFNGTSGNLTVSYSGSGNSLTSSSIMVFTEANSTTFIYRISLIDTSTDSSMGYVNVIA